MSKKQNLPINSEFFSILGKTNKMTENYNKKIAQNIIGISFVFFIHHLLLWIMSAKHVNKSFAEFLGHWDANWYFRITTHGYDAQSIAFYPLFPSLVKIINSALNNLVPVTIIGSVISSLFFISFILIIYNLLKLNNSAHNWLLPKTFFGFVFFLYTPASYVFHSNHTESTFLLFSFLAFYFSIEKKWIIASIFAGLCALTKNQGILLAMTIGMLNASYVIDLKEKLKIFIYSGCIAFSFFSIYLIYQYIEFGSIFAFIDAQKYWEHSISLNVFNNLFLIIKSFFHQNLFYKFEIVYFFLILFGAFLILKKSKIIFFYILSCLLCIVIMGDFINTFRYSSFLFPVLFTLGDYFSKKNKILIFIILILLIYLNHQMARNYVLLRWSY
jgi:Gpi18-like mannosyltransferase